VHVRSRSSKPSKTTHNTNTSTNKSNTNHLEDSTVFSGVTEKTVEPIPAPQKAETDAEDCEEHDHRNGLHKGRDPYGLASKPFLDRGERVPWGRCGECEKEKEKKGGNMMKGMI
jgi:hypothetical protein